MKRSGTGYDSGQQNYFHNPRHPMNQDKLENQVRNGLSSFPL